MPIGWLKNLDDILVTTFRGADNLGSLRSALSGIAEEMDAALKSSDPEVLEDFMRTAARSEDPAVARIFRSPQMKDAMRYERGSHHFTEEITRIIGEGGTLSRADLENLRTKYELPTDHGGYVEARQAIADGRIKTGFDEAAGSGGRQTKPEKTMSEMRAGFAGLASPFSWPYAILGKMAQEFPAGSVGRRALLVTQGGYAVTAIGGGTALTIGTGLHLYTEGRSTAAATEAMSEFAQGTHEWLQEHWPAAAAWLDDNASDIGEKTALLVMAQSDMIRQSLTTLNDKHGWGMDERAINVLTQGVQGNAVFAALSAAEVEITPEDVKAAIETAQGQGGTAEEKDARLFEILAEQTGKTPEELKALMPEVIDASQWTPEQIQEFATSGKAPEAVASTVAAVTSTEGIAERLRREREEVSAGLSEMSDHARRLDEIRKMSSTELRAEFNEATSGMGFLEMLTSPTVLIASLLDMIGLDDWADGLKKKFLVENTVSQFGDKFDVLDRGKDLLASLDPREPEPVPGN